MKVLVVDDDRVLADVVSFTLRREGYQIIQAHDGEAALQRWANEQPDLIILDVNMPKMDGFAVLERIRAKDNTPILLLSVRGEEADIVGGLNLGADDYITKPFSPKQLVARVQAIMRRADQKPTSSFQQVRDIHFSPNRREVTIGDGLPIALTRLESNLLECLMINAGQIMTSEMLIDSVWGPLGGDRDMLRQMIHRLRNKIEPDPKNPVYISTVPGLGYGLNKG